MQAQYQFAAGECWCHRSTQLYTQQKQAKAEQRVTVWTAEEEQQQRVWLSVSHKMTFIHSHPDSTDPCEEAEEGGREEGRWRDLSVHYPLSSVPASETDTRLSHGRRQRRGVRPPRGKQGEGQKTKRNGKEKRDAFNEKMVANQIGMGCGTQIKSADREGRTGEIKTQDERSVVTFLSWKTLKGSGKCASGGSCRLRPSSFNTDKRTI